LCAMPSTPRFLPTGLIINDPDYVPAGSKWLQGITPLRVAAIVAVSVLVAAAGVRGRFSTAGFAPEAFQLWLVRTFEVLVAAFPMTVAVIQAEIRTRRSSNRKRLAALLASVVGGAAVYSLVFEFVRGDFGSLSRALVIYLTEGLHGGAPPGLETSPWRELLSIFFRALVPGALLATALFLTAKEQEAQRRAHEARVAAAELERQVAEAWLQLLQAQIEPHFLFNTLASVKVLYDREPGDARRLLRNLRDYLEVAITTGRDRETTLGAEAALANAYASIFRVRMGERLEVRVDVPAELESARMPPLMLGTLLENAIKHGISPRAGGGRVEISAARHGDVLELKVADDGVGFRASEGTGVGLANTRARLQSLFGDHGSLDMDTNAAGGVTAVIRLPYHA